MANKKIALVTVLPLRGVGHILEGGKKREGLANGYSLVARESLPELNKFNEDYMTKIVSTSDWSNVKNAPAYLQVSYTCPFQSDMGSVEAKGSEYCGEKIDRFLLALNINEKLWSFRPDIRLGWFEKDLPLSRQNIRVRHHSPISTSDDNLILQDFRRAARLTAKMDEVYSDFDEKKTVIPL
jgi:hypothetical protein